VDGYIGKSTVGLQEMKEWLQEPGREGRWLEKSSCQDRGWFAEGLLLLVNYKAAFQNASWFPTGGLLGGHLAVWRDSPACIASKDVFCRHQGPDSVMQKDSMMIYPRRTPWDREEMPREC
jgi:hypothetical protein